MFKTASFLVVSSSFPPSGIRKRGGSECKRSDLCEEGDEIRSRLEGRGRRPLKERLCEDVWVLVRHIRGKKKL